MSGLLGLGELRGQIKRVERDLDAVADPAAMAAGEPIKEAWKGLVPILDGHYRDSLVVVSLGKGKAGIGTSWVAGLPRNEQPVMYAKRLELGTHGTRAQPSARPALAQSRGAALEAAEVPLRSIVIRGRRAPKVVA